MGGKKIGRAVVEVVIKSKTLPFISIIIKNLSSICTGIEVLIKEYNDEYPVRFWWAYYVLLKGKHEKPKMEEREQEGSLSLWIWMLIQRRM